VPSQRTLMHIIREKWGISNQLIQRRRTHAVSQSHSIDVNGSGKESDGFVFICRARALGRLAGPPAPARASSIEIVVTEVVCYDLYGSKQLSSYVSFPLSLYWEGWTLGPK
jgi:hypothetical protein